jgi:lipopolysaccharide/colanic/teichoic acid biosynthesis glycosyltransferase
MDGGHSTHTIRAPARRSAPTLPRLEQPRLSAHIVEAPTQPLLGQAPLAEPFFEPPPLSERHSALGRKQVWTNRPVGGVIKRAFDITVAAGALAALSPVLFSVWVLVRLESPGPGLFRQRRGGFLGRPFYIYKFRTMRTQESKQITQAKKVDARITRLGAFLRKNSVDELPQLLNVLLGDMSIVGPRPHALAHDRKFLTFDRRYANRHRARPGITGLAQVSGSRGPTDTDEKISERIGFDLDYVAKWSFFGDIGIILKTAWVVIRDRNVF